MFYIFITYNIVSKKNNQRAFEYKSIQRTADLVTVNKKKTILAQTPNDIYFPHKNSVSLPNFHRFVNGFYTMCVT